MYKPNWTRTGMIKFTLDVNSEMFLCISHRIAGDTVVVSHILILYEGNGQQTTTKVNLQTSVLWVSYETVI